MGCVSSKGDAHVTPALDSSSHDSSVEFRRPLSLCKGPPLDIKESREQMESGESANTSSVDGSSVRISLRNLPRHTEGEQVTAGWPSWLSSVAGEAIQGWVPLKAECFVKLDKVGQGTYSTVFRSHEVGTGRIVALKKVRFDNFEPDSVRFMAREILILRKLNHPNIIKLEGIISSRQSCSIYLVFEYMEHDLAGLISSPDVKLSQSQIKCYVHQLLSGLEQCHSRGILHRDIKSANVLVNNEGILKIADFGLANIVNPEAKQPLTTRVVTLWYRPPELLLGSTDYEASVDLWSIGCVFAEFFFGRPILQGRTEVEQIHKIFKLCGSPTEEFWKKIRWPHASVFRSQQIYGNCLQKSLGFLPKSAFKLLETLLSIDPSKRGTASSALDSEYFKTKPYACDPSSLPRYQPNKEIDAKHREDLQRRSTIRRSSAEAKVTSRSHKPSVESDNLSKTANNKDSRAAAVTIRSSTEQENPRVYGGTRQNVDQQPLPNIMLRDENPHIKQTSQRERASAPLQAPSCTIFACPQKLEAGYSDIRTHTTTNSRQDRFRLSEPSNISQAKITCKLNEGNGDVGRAAYLNAKYSKSYESDEDVIRKRCVNPDFKRSVYSLGAYGAHDPVLSKNRIAGYKNRRNKMEFSGPLLVQSNVANGFLEKHERHVRRASRKSWFQKGKKGN